MYPKVKQFEGEFSVYADEKYAVAVNSCTAALHLSLLSLGIGKGDEVITTAMTFCATVNAIIHTGATPVIVDCDPYTCCIDPEAISAVITSRTKAIVPVHFAGMACDMPSIMSIAEKNGLYVVEDCAHAIETTYDGKHVGTFGDFGCFSFYVTKNVVTGEGGMVLTGDKYAAERIKISALHGMSAGAWRRFSDDGYKHYQVMSAGYKYNMTDMQAAIGIHQLGRVEENWLRRKEIWGEYNNRLSGLPVTLPAKEQPNIRHGYHLYTILVDEESCGITRDNFLVEMTKRNIGVGVHYRCIPTHPYYNEAFGWQPEDYPNSYRIGESTVSIPLSSRLSDQDVSDVVDAISSILA